MLVNYMLNIYIHLLEYVGVKLLLSPEKLELLEMVAVLVIIVVALSLPLSLPFINGMIKDKELDYFDNIGLISYSILNRLSSIKATLILGTVCFFIYLSFIINGSIHRSTMFIVAGITLLWIFCISYTYFFLIRNIDRDLLDGIKKIEEANKESYKIEVGKIREKMYRYSEIALILGLVFFIIFWSAFCSISVIDKTILKTFIGVGAIANIISVISGLNSLDSGIDLLLWKYDEKNFLDYIEWGRHHSNPYMQLLRKLNLFNGSR